MHTCTEQARFADLHNLPKPRWRHALGSLLSPAARLHRYRNLHREMFYDAMSQLDCKDGHE
jgi:hypothetical protein